MEVKMSEALLVALSTKGYLEDGYNKCTVTPEGLKFSNTNDETIIINWEQLNTL